MSDQSRKGLITTDEHHTPTPNPAAQDQLRKLAKGGRNQHVPRLADLDDGVIRQTLDKAGFRHISATTWRSWEGALPRDEYLTLEANGVIGHCRYVNGHPTRLGAFVPPAGN